MNQWILLFSLILGLGGTGCENREPGRLGQVVHLSSFEFTLGQL